MFPTFDELFFSFGVLRNIEGPSTTSFSLLSIFFELLRVVAYVFRILADFVLSFNKLLGLS
jgi:hypothetical protein